MELHQLKYFVAVADLRSFTNAAERCFVSQPSLSQQIIKLEKELGQRLFERLGRKVRLTDAGQTLYQQAVSILASVEQARRCVGASNEQEGIVNLGVIPTMAPYLLPPLVREFRSRCPNSNLMIHEDLTDHVIENCLRGEFDLGILALPVAESQLHVEPLLDEELLLALPAKHPLATRRRITFDDLNGYPFVLLSEMHCLGQQILSLCDEQSCRPAMTCRSAQLLTVQELVSAGHGVSLLPAMACRLDRDRRRHYRRLSGVRPTRTVAMIWHKQRYQRPIVQRFVELLRASVRSNRARSASKGFAS